MRRLRLLHVGLMIMILGGWVSALRPSATSAQQDRPRVTVLTFEGAVTPVLEQYIENGIQSALADGADALILQLDTPGGSVNITKSIVQKMLVSPVPVVVYVAPTGAHAGSAGTFITLAGHAASMAPGASIGAASPVGSGGEDVGETMEAKVKNILSADIENLAERRGEEATRWAIAAVQEAEAATAQQALKLGVIDFISADLDELLQQLDGLEVVVNGDMVTLQTAQADVEAIELSSLQRFLNFISDPAIASILFSIGLLGIIAEIRTPGFGVPGIAGIIALLLAFYALGQLDANFAGLALIGVALALFVAEAFTPTFGLLAVGGMIAFVLGAMLLFDAPGVEMPWLTIILLAVSLGGFTIWAGGMALVAQRRPVRTGSEAMIGQMAKAKASFQAGEAGSVFIAGEWWNAELDSGEVATGDAVEVIGRKGYTLQVKRAL